MLLDYGGSWLMSVREEAATSIPGAGGAATLPALFLFLLFALQSDSQKSFDFRLSLFALQGFQNVNICIVVKL